MLLDNVPFRSEQAAALRICFSKCCAEPCSSRLQHFVQLVITQHSHFMRMTIYYLQMFNDRRAARRTLVHDFDIFSAADILLCSSTLEFVSCGFPLHLALPVEAVAAAAMATIGKVGLAMDFDSSDTTERDGAKTTVAGGDGGDDDNGRAPPPIWSQWSTS